MPPSTPDFSPMPMVHAANAALLERTPFAIDDAKDDEDETDDELQDTGDDDQVMDEVWFIGRNFKTITSHVYSLNPRLMHSWKPMILV
jgi:hypothetical protein